MKLLLSTLIFLLTGWVTTAQTLPTLPAKSETKPKKQKEIKVKPKTVTPQPIKTAKPPISTPTNSSQVIKFNSNSEADLFIDGEKKGRLIPGEVLKLELKKGDYLIRIISVQNPNDMLEKTYQVSQSGGESLFRADLLDVINRRLEVEASTRDKKEVKTVLVSPPVNNFIEPEKEKGSENMIFVEGGFFKMGSNNSGQRPVHEVKLTSFYISKYEVTFDEYDAFCTSTGKEKPSDENQGRGNRPVINVSWDDAVEYCSWLSQKFGKAYRLPTEAEWEYAARGGNKSNNFIYSGSNNINEVAWYKDNSNDNNHPVGQKQANELGLYDMSGNVWEWCNDWYSETYYRESQSSNPQGPNGGGFLEQRVMRGGGAVKYGNTKWTTTTFRSAQFKSAKRSYLGFRVVHSL